MASKSSKSSKESKTSKKSKVDIKNSENSKKRVNASKKDVSSKLEMVTEKSIPIKTKMPKPSKVEKGHVVSVDYVGSLDNGEEFDNSKNNGPIKFVVGNGQVIKGFDDAVIGMKVNDSKKFKISKDNAYGDINPTLLHKVPLAKLPQDLKDQVKIGGFLVMQSPTGQHIPAKVKSMDKENVTLDLNHPLAGKDLTFNIKIVDISHNDPSSKTHSHGKSENSDCECGGNCGCSDDGCSEDDCDCKK